MESHPIVSRFIRLSASYPLATTPPEKKDALTPRLFSLKDYP
jgi:hypothetical protein